MGCACYESKAPADSDPVASKPFPRKETSTASVEEDKSQPSVGPSLRFRCTQFCRGYKVVTPYRVGSVTGLFLGELKRTCKPCIAHVLELPEHDIKRTKDRNELKAAYEQLDHPYIRALLGIQKEHNKLHVLFETCEDGELVSHLLEQRVFSELQVALIAKQLLQVLSYLHGRNLSHGKLDCTSIGFKQLQPTDVTIKVAGLFFRKWARANQLSEYDPPEQVTKSSKWTADIWSCGVLLYQMLTGRLPFSSRERMGAIEFHGVSREAQDLLRPMLQMSPDSRPTAASLLGLPWLHHESLDFKSFRHRLLQLREVRPGNSLHSALLFFVIDNFVESAKLCKISKVFTKINTSHTGTLSKEEVLKAMRLVMTEAQAEAETEHIWAAMSQNKGSCIEFSEFVVAALEPSTVKAENTLAKAFRALDMTNNGLLSVRDLTAIFGLERAHDNPPQDFMNWAQFVSFLRSHVETTPVKVNH